MRSAPGCRCFAGGAGNGRRGLPTPPRPPPPAPGSFRDRLRRRPAHADPSSTPACLQRSPSSNQHPAVSRGAPPPAESGEAVMETAVATATPFPLRDVEDLHDADLERVL